MLMARPWGPVSISPGTIYGLGRWIVFCAGSLGPCDGVGRFELDEHAASTPQSATMPEKASRPRICSAYPLAPKKLHDLLDLPGVVAPPVRELESTSRRSVDRMNARLIVVTLMASATLLTGCGSRTGATPTPSAASLSSGAIQVTTAPSCPGEQQQGGGEIDLFPLGVADNGRAYTLVRCQAVDALLLHPKEDGCRWTTVQSSDAAVVAILPIPLPLPPGGSTNEAFIAGAPGQATLSSSLVCSSGAPQQWHVTLTVRSTAPAGTPTLPPD